MWWLITGLGITIITGITMRRWANRVRQQAYDHAQEEASLEKLRFLQRLDHELKNPLTVMQIALANLEETSDAEKRREIGTDMRGQILRMAHLVGDLRKLATLEKGIIERVAVDIGGMLNEVTLVFREREEAAHRNFSTDFDPAELPSIVGDRDLLQLAVYNLIDNAVKFTTNGDTITLRATVEEGSIVIQVIDSGRGIPEDDLPHVWEDLYRSPDVHGIPGSGVGLAMVRGIIEQHGGTVSITSEVRTGTTVTVTIPAENN